MSTYFYEKLSLHLKKSVKFEFQSNIFEYYQLKIYKKTNRMGFMGFMIRNEYQIS